MIYKIKDVTTKPANVKWFSHEYPELFEAIVDRNFRIAGMTTDTLFPDNNTIVKIYTFENEEAYNNFLNAEKDDEYEKARDIYNKENNVVNVREVTTE